MEKQKEDNLHYLLA